MSTYITPGVCRVDTVLFLRYSSAMPYRKLPIATGEIYHVFNRSVAKQPIFLTFKDHKRAMAVIKFYRHGDLPMRFSFYNRLPEEQKSLVSETINSNPHIIEVLAFCLMPNHIHFLIKNLTEDGIIKFMSNLQNSYAKYFNTRHERTGTLFQPMFKAVRIESDEQLIHVCRYIHLNPITSYVVKAVSDLEKYAWSSYPDYLKISPTFINRDLVLSFFKDLRAFKEFTVNQVDYQRKLDQIRHLALE